MDQDREDRIRLRAHQLWEAEGQPHGSHDEHWRRAEEEVDAEKPASARAFADAAGTPTGTDLASDAEASSVTTPVTDDPEAAHAGRITPAG